MIFTFSSAKGSPGVTTSALLFALSWPGPVLLIEADPSGGSIAAGYLSGDLPDVERSILELALAHRRGDSISADLLDEWALGLSDTARFIVGSPGPGQASFCAPLWEPLSLATAELSRRGVDVLVDLGRLDPDTGPWLQHGDVNLLVTRTTMPALAAAQSAAAAITTVVGSDRGVGVLTIGTHEPYGASEIEQALGLDVTASLANDPVTAEAFSLGRSGHSTSSRQLSRSRLLRSVPGALQSVRAVGSAPTAEQEARSNA